MKTYIILLTCAFLSIFSTTNYANDNVSDFNEYIDKQEELINNLLNDNDKILLAYLDSLQTLCDNSLHEKHDVVGAFLNKRNYLIINALIDKSIVIQNYLQVLNNKYENLKNIDKDAFKANLKNQEYVVDAFNNKQAQLISSLQILQKEYNYLSKKEKLNYPDIFNQQKSLILSKLNDQNNTLSVYLTSIKNGISCNNLHKLASY